MTACVWPCLVLVWLGLPRPAALPSSLASPNLEAVSVHPDSAPAQAPQPLPSLGSGKGPALPSRLDDRQSSARLRRALEPWHARFDSAECLLELPLDSPGYHTTLTNGWVHPTRESLIYAVALLDTGGEELRRRAEAILYRVIFLQDQDPRSRTFGIWPWYAEEPLEQMSPPDFNWADFCAVQLLQVVLDHQERLQPELQPLVDHAIQRAARSIRRRNVGPDYTNIAIMGSYVTWLTAEIYGDGSLFNYAMTRWQRFHQFTLRNGAFSEYNSPAYTVIALQELDRMRRHVRNPEARVLAEEVYRLAWEEMAQHFHPPTRQWAGPHSRSYETLLGHNVWALLRRATEGRVDFGVDEPTLDEGRAPMPCPPDLEASFLRLAEPKELRKTFVRGATPVVGTTYLDATLALGSINCGDLWNQRRALVAYWGSAEQPAYLHLRFLHDGYDYSSAYLSSVQKQGRVLGLVHFATDGGDRHPSLQRLTNGILRARDLRLRFEFGGRAGGRAGQFVRTGRGSAWAQFDKVQVRVTTAHAAWDGAAPRYEIGGDDAKAWFDIVLYDGAARDFDFTSLYQAAIGFGLELSTEIPHVPTIDLIPDEDRLTLVWRDLTLTGLVRPVDMAQLRSSYRAETEAP